MKKILCIFMAFVLCVLICTETTVVKTAKAENVPTAITFGPVSFELPDGWDAINYDASDLGYSERLMFEFKDYVSRRMTLVPAEEMNACFFIEYGDAWEYTIKCMEKLSMPVDMYEESDQENLRDCLADVSLMISIFERFADTYGIPYENISVGKTDQYDYACMTYNPSALLPELKEMGYEYQILSCAVCADGYCVWLHLVPLKGTYKYSMIRREMA